MYDPKAFMCPFLDDMCICHIISTILMCILGLIHFFSWMSGNSPNTWFYWIYMPIIIFLIIDYATWVYILNKSLNKTDSLFRWIKLNYGINLDNVKFFIFDAFIDFITQINESLKQITK